MFSMTNNGNITTKVVEFDNYSFKMPHIIIIFAECRTKFGALIDRVCVEGHSIEECLIECYKALDRGEDRDCCAAINQRCREEILAR